MPSTGQITLFTGNILENGTVTVTGSPDAGYPEERLWDRAISLYWKVTAAATNYEIHVYYPADSFGYADADELGWDDDVFGYGGAISNACDLLYIVGHNFDGKVCYWEYSDNDTDWVEAVAHWTQDGNLAIGKLAAGATGHDYWRFRVLNIANPTAAEIWMGKGRTFTVLARPKPSEKDVSNVNRTQSIGGSVRIIKMGEARKNWMNYIRLPGDADLAKWKNAMREINGHEKPFLVKDINGYYYFMELDSDPPIEYDEFSRKWVDLSVLEVL